MTDQKELRTLISRVRDLPEVWVHVDNAPTEDEPRRTVKRVRIESTRRIGVGPCWMSPIYAAETMRALLGREAA